MTETDWTDRHVARWRDHWIDIHFDDQVEGIVVRIGRLARHLKSKEKPNGVLQAP